MMPLLLLLSLIAQAQLVKPPKWTFTLTPTELQVGSPANLVMEAEIPMGWYVYSNDFAKDLGPILTTFELEKIKRFFHQWKSESHLIQRRNLMRFGKEMSPTFWGKEDSNSL